MKTHASLAVILIASLCATAPLSADIGKVGGAAIGKIGSPVTPSNAPKNQDDSANAIGQAQEDAKTKEPINDTPIANIVFNRSHIYFRQVLGNAVIQNERDNPGANYELVSSIPSISANSKKQDRLNRVYGNNLNTVRNELQRLGIGPERIRMRTEMRLDDKPQEVSVYSNK